MMTPPKTFAGKVPIHTDASWDAAFWFAVFSPVLGILIGFLALLLVYH
jgi:hypothetical protein